MPVGGRRAPAAGAASALVGVSQWGAGGDGGDVGCSGWNADPRDGRSVKPGTVGFITDTESDDVPSPAFKFTFSQPSGGSRAKKRLICGDVPNLEPSRSGDEHTLPPEE